MTAKDRSRLHRGYKRFLRQTKNKETKKKKGSNPMRRECPL